MIIQLCNNISDAHKQAIVETGKEIIYKTTEAKTQEGYYLIGLGSSDFDIGDVGQMSGISDIHIVSDSYKLVSKKWKVAPSIINLGDSVTISQHDV